MTSPAGAQNKEIDCLSPEAQKLAEARLAAKRAARAEAREIRMKELERQQKEVEERPDKDFIEKGSRNMPSLSAATLASLGGTSSRRGSGDTSISIDTEASIREIKDSLAEVEEKYKKAMVSNAQLDNEKTNFMYQVDTLKDMLLELEEQLAESQRQYEEKSKEFEREKHAHSVLQFQFAEVKEALRQREEMLEKHGIILNSEIATNGETSDTPNDFGYQGPSKMTKEELNTLKSAGEGTLGKAKEVEVKKEIVENVGKRETLQNTEHEQPKPNTGKDCVDTGLAHPGESAEDRRLAEDSTLSPGPLAGAKCEQQQVQSQAQENTSLFKSPEQIESHEVTNKPDGSTRNSLEQSNCLGDLDSEVSGPADGQVSCDALGIKNQSGNSAGGQDNLKQEGLKTGSEKVSFEPCPDYALGQIPEVDKVSCADSRDTENVVQEDGAAAGEHVDTVASSPLEHSKGTVSSNRSCVNDEVGQSSERELTQEVAEPEEGLIESPQDGGGNTVTKVEDTDVREEKPTLAEQSNHQNTTGPDAKEPNKEKREQHAEALDSPQKKTKNKKKKNKKKKTPAPVETCRDGSKESHCQNTEAGDVEEEEQFTNKAQAAGPQSEETEELEQNVAAASGEHVDCPEDPKNELNGKQNQEEEEGAKIQARKVTADGDALTLEADTAQASGTRAAGEEELGHEDGRASAQHPGQTVEKVLDGHSLDSSDMSGEPESGEQARGEIEKGKNKEDCTMS